MKNMAKQVTNRVSIMLPETGTETVKQLSRVHFLDSKLIELSDDGQGRQNLGICGCITNRGDWNLATYVINQSIKN
jgi:hypothetical protein